MKAMVLMMENHRMKKNKKRWSVVDTVIILLILVSVAGLVYRVVYAARKDADADPTMYRVEFEVMETHRSVLDEIQAFDAVYLYENDVRLGYVGAYETSVTGKYVAALFPVSNAEDEARATATGVMICANATLSSGGGLQVGDSGRYLTPGSVLEVRTDRALLTIRVTSVREHS